MANDHYVAETYLKHFAGPTGMLRAFRKSDGHSYTSKPKGLCREPDGDIIPDFLDDPAYLGAFRSAFEPAWNEAIDAVKARKLNARVKLHIAGYWANLLVCTPAWRRVGIEVSNNDVLHTVDAHTILSAEQGKRDVKLEEAVAAVRNGQVRIETEPDYIRARFARHVMRYAWALYNAEWTVFENDTAIEFVTSDNPAAFEDQGDHWTAGRPFVRLLPITPRLCLMCDLTRKPQYIQSEPDFDKDPDGKVKGGPIGLSGVERINSAIAKCAEDLVLAGDHRDYVRDLTAQYSRFRISGESASFRQPDGSFVIANRTRVIERKGDEAAA